jgi:septal ring factor EnvC (AmiA/AmiB activator)
MYKKGFLLPALFFFCFFAFPQEQPSGLEPVFTLPSERLRNIAASLEELEQSETVSLEDLTRLKEDLGTLKDSLANSEAMLTELRTQVDDVLERYEKLWQRYEKQQRSLRAWRTGCLGSSGLTVILIVLLALL